MKRPKAADRNQQSVENLLQAGIPHQQRSLYEKLVRITGRGFLDYLAERDDTSRDDQQFLLLLMRYLRRQVLHHLEAIATFRTLASDFNARMQKAVTERERERCILQFASDIGGSSTSLRGDRRALKRWMGADTVLERCSNRIGRKEYALVFLLQALTTVAQKALRGSMTSQRILTIWAGLELEQLSEKLLAYRGDERIRVAVFRCLAETIRVLPRDIHAGALKQSTRNFIYRSALHQRQQVWIQVEALHLLAVLSPDDFTKVVYSRLGKPQEGDDIFVRQRALLLIAEQIASSPELLDLVKASHGDPSPYVRQAIPVVLANALSTHELRHKRRECLEQLRSIVIADHHHQVRAAAMLQFPGLVKLRNLAPDLTETIKQVFCSEQNSFVIRTALKVYREVIVQLREHSPERALLWKQSLLPNLVDLKRGHEDLAVRRWAVHAINFSEVFLDEDLYALYCKLQEAVDSLKLGTSRSFSKNLIGDFEDDQLGRVLALLVEEDAGLTVDRGIFRVRITRGDRFTFRLWRLFHELRRPSPDKRQAHDHTIGRLYLGSMHAPSPIMAELTQTKVPGEPLLQEDESSWRPYLPLLDQLYNVLSLWRPKLFRIYTAEGRTDLRAPRYLLQRCRARLVLTFRFGQLAELRNWTEERGGRPTAYVEALRNLGFGISFTPYSQKYGQEPTWAEDPAVERFFQLLPLPLNYNFYGQFKAYLFTIYDNSLYELAVFGLALTLLFCGLRLTASLVVRRARRRIKLVVGGWGTRGKSGVERLKAALFEGLGHPILSKSTGCEAMFLHGPHFKPCQEMFLFRSYDKATIWEHHNLIKMADSMDCSVFLWECMGLTPSYVEILQQRWSRDDFATITNTYPDHEDIQGPAGYNIPLVMRNFIPDHAILLTTEEQMQPILRQDAAQKQTEFLQVGWLEAGLLTDDILERFPYNEHPYNIALVVALARRLGVPWDLALKEMADRVIPDIGVLKSFPQAAVRGRKLEFVNGMSANERFATLSNWQRMGFTTPEEGADPGTVLHVLVNNRADRISRSQMFGAILAEDIAADRYILIGSNLSGLQGYISASWNSYLKKLTARLENSRDSVAYLELLSSAAHRLRIPTGRDFLARRFSRMLAGQADGETTAQILSQIDNIEEIPRHLEALELPYAEEYDNHIGVHLQRFHEYKRMKEKLEAGISDGKSVLDELRLQLNRWFMDKIFVVEDFHASGDQVVAHICTLTPPGLLCRIMGMQNIKGTGLDFVYRWQAWERCRTSCEKLQEEDPALMEEGLFEMIAFQDFGLLSEDYVRQSLERLKARAVCQSERFQAGIQVIQKNLEAKLQFINDSMGRSPEKSGGIVAVLVSGVEALLDAGDAISRKRIAEKIYRDLEKERISHQRAAIELQALNKRQKGGWLLKRLKR